MQINFKFCIFYPKDSQNDAILNFYFLYFVIKKSETVIKKEKENGS